MSVTLRILLRGYHEPCSWRWRGEVDRHGVVWGTPKRRPRFRKLLMRTWALFAALGMPTFFTS